MGLRMDSIEAVGAGLVWGGFRVQSIIESPGSLDLLQEMAREFPLFIDLLRNVEIGWARRIWEPHGFMRRWYRMRTAANESSPCSKRSSVALSVHSAITGQTEPLREDPVLARSIRLRNPDVDPMHLIQVDMLRRKRAGEDTAGGQSGDCRNHQRHLCRPAQHRVILPGRRPAVPFSGIGSGKAAQKDLNRRTLSC